jgi:NADH:ubiquinone oxidoreductase subunit 4 (subunit M)
MDPMDRRRNVVLFALAAASWVVVAVVASSLNPLADPNAGMVGALVLGLAAGLTAAPLFWLVGFVRQRRIAYRGDWVRAVRRGAWIGVLVAVFVVMRLNGLFQPQIGLFFIALALVAEITLSSGGAGRG